MTNRIAGDLSKMSPSDHEGVIAKLDVLANELARTMQNFEATGFAAILKDDYVELHRLEHRIQEMRVKHVGELGLHDTQLAPSGTSH